MVRRGMLLLLVLGVWGTTEPSAVTAASTLAAMLRAHFQASSPLDASRPLRIAGNVLGMPAAVSAFYAQRAYRLAWVAQTGPVVRTATLVEALHSAADDGLDPQDYHLAILDGLLADIHRHQHTSTSFDPARLVELDMLLSDAFIAYATHLTSGRTQEALLAPPASMPQLPNMVQLLQQAIEHQRMAETLRQLLPVQSGYRRLRQALRWYREMAAAGGWPHIPGGPTLRWGDRGDRVKALRARLVMTGDLAQPFFPGHVDDALYVHETDVVFDEALERAVQAFQRRHGLHADGAVGRGTLAALNVPVQEHIRRMVVNLERWRRQRVAVHDRHIEVNIPGFTLKVMESDQSHMTMRVIVGTEDQPTPVLQTTMTHVILSPHWRVPSRIAKEEILPRLRQDPLYLRTQNIRVLQGWGAGARLVDTTAIDWSAIQPERFPYRFRQEPGPRNALGRVKFQFPNEFSIYMHDTPKRALFTKPSRALSHGCVRVERPLELAVYLLREETRWTPKRLRIAIQRGTEQWVNLPRAIPVQMVYRTVWVDTDGTVHFRPDIYGYDVPQDAAQCDASPVACS